MVRRMRHGGPVSTPRARAGVLMGTLVANPQYVRNVRALMTECVCLGY
jgi:hypothetical protein